MSSRSNLIPSSPPNSTLASSSSDSSSRSRTPLASSSTTSPPNQPISLPTPAEYLRNQQSNSLLLQPSDLNDHPAISTDESSTNISFLNGLQDSTTPIIRKRSISPGSHDGILSTFRDHSRSPRSPLAEVESSWWGPERHVARPWHDSPKKTEALQNTRKKVAQAIASALGTAVDVAHEALFIGVDLLEFAPIPGLKPAAQLLLNIWDASQQVDMNTLGCLRLTERCAVILISVRAEIFEAGDVLARELAIPIRRLEESFEGVYYFLNKQTTRPFLKRYLRRDQIFQDRAACDASLRDALTMFNISIQIRILKEVQDTEKQRQEETKAILEAIRTGRLPSPISPTSATSEEVAPPYAKYPMETTHITTTDNILGLFEDSSHLPSIEPHDLSPSQIIPALTSLHSVQNSLDTAMDTADLRQLMRTALQTTSDAEMLEVLGVGHQEMPDAIKTLQRALEHITERDGESVEVAPAVRSVVVENPRQRSRTVISIDSSSTSSSSLERKRDTLDREFIETGIDALRRMSRGVETSLPSWTITRYEIDRENKIGVGFFSDVYKGTWRGRTVAIKVLAQTTPRKLFVREMGIWKTLRHPNVVPLYGASSASGDPPWFFVSPYMKNGSIVSHLKRIELEERPSSLGITAGSTPMPLSPIRSPGSGLGSPAWRGVRNLSPSRHELTPPPGGRTPIQEDSSVHREWDLFRFMHEIAKGMEYLHSRGVFHGDLKGANILVDDKYRCVIADFGQSEMKSEVFRLSRNPLPHGTLRWQSPELMAGQSQLSQEIDVWAFAICCTEILTMGRIPWPLHDDDSVRHFVLKDDSRPPLPEYSRFNTQGLQDILRACWATKPVQRPTFSKLVKDFKQLRRNSDQEVVDSPRSSVIDELSELSTSPSPDMRPTCLPDFVQSTDNDLPDDVLPEMFHSPQQLLNTAVPVDGPHPENTISSMDIKTPEIVIYTPLPSSRSSSFVIHASGEKHPNVIDYDGYDSPPPPSEMIAMIQNERRYRLLLTHDYHSSLTLPLWEPCPVEVGAVGYLSKPRGRFVTLFNALTPGKATHPGTQSLPSIHGYGRAQVGTHRQDRRTVTQKGMDAFAGLLTFRTFSEKVSRRYSYPLKAGHKMAHLCTETTDYRYLEELDAAKKWFRTHVDSIMQTYGAQHHIQKEDLFLVIGTLSAPNHALFVSHSHPEGHVHFSVYATLKNGKPWGAFTTDTEVPPELGPSYSEAGDSIIPVQGCKVSNHGGPWDAVVLARLRFKPDVMEPTSK